FAISAILALAALLLAFVLVPETRSALDGAQADLLSPKLRGSLASLPRPLSLFTALLLLDFVATFSFAFIEPQMVFYMYNYLLLTPTQLGIIVGGYGLAMLIGQAGLGQLSDRYGRKPLIVLGLLLGSALYPGLIFLQQFGWLFVMAVISGIGSSLI